MNTSVTLRPFPYPYRAALTICSDIDNTADSTEFLAIQQFLSTTDETSMGSGVGLEIGNSFFFYDTNREFSYFTSDARAQAIIIDLIHAGYLDVLHSYGDAANSAAEIDHSIEALNKHGCRLPVWVNHHGSRNNIGGKFDYMLTYSEGDLPDSETYHMDRTAALGIRYAWVGATTRQIGQDVDRRALGFRTLWDARHKKDSAMSFAKEGRKWALGRFGDERFRLHSANQLTRPLRLRDGTCVHEFQRYGHHPEGVSYAATSAGLAYMISAEKLSQLIKRGGTMIVYSHLGKNDGFEHVVAPETQAALRHLAKAQAEGHVYVTTTAKLLAYNTAHRYLDFTSTFDWETDSSQIRIHCVNDPIFGPEAPTKTALQGITFYVPDAERTTIYLRDQQIQLLQRNPQDETGRESVSIPIQRLTYPY